MMEVAVLGATGYTGSELLRLLWNHPEVNPVYISSESHAGENVSRVHPQLREVLDLTLQPMKVENIPEGVKVVFCALPHGQSAEVVAELLLNGYRVIDLSADYRLKEPLLYKEWYDLDHPHPHLLNNAVYGLPELYKKEILSAELLANPGCYPTSVILALAPLLVEKLIIDQSIIIDSKSGVSGAGRTPKQTFHFPECTENFKAYRVAAHQHTPEIEQELGKLGQTDLKILFTPHLVPMVRGILSTIYVDLNEEKEEKQLQKLFTDYYGDCPFVRVLKNPELPETRFVRGSNYCDIALRRDRRTGRLVVISAIDNLVKGASGQAIQNMNIMFGLKESTGINQIAI